MSNKELDKYFKAEKALEYQTPPIEIWDNLEREMKMRKKRRRVFVLWMVFGLSIFGLVSLLVLKSTSDSSPAFKKKDVAILMDLPLTPSEKKDILNADDKNFSGFSEIQTEVENQSSSKKKTESEKTPLKNSSNQTKKNVDLQRDIKSTVRSLDSNQNEYKFTEMEGHEDLPILAEQSFRNTFDFEDINTIDFQVHRSFEILEMVAPAIVEPYAPRANSFAITAMMDLGRPSFRIDQASNNSTSFVAPWYSIGARLQISYGLSDRLKILVGSSYRLSKRKFDYESDDLLLVGYDNGQPSVNPPKLGRLISRGEQRFGFLDVSCGMSYEFLKGRVMLSADLEWVFNMKLHTSGKTLDAHSIVIRYGDEDGHYQSNLGMGVAPALRMGVPLGSTSSFYTALRFVYYFDPLENSILTSTYMYSNTAISVGYGLRF